jgi:hypothetical protein
MEEWLEGVYGHHSTKRAEAASKRLRILLAKLYNDHRYYFPILPYSARFEKYWAAALADSYDTTKAECAHELEQHLDARFVSQREPLESCLE